MTEVREKFWTDEYEATWEGFDSPMEDDGRYLDITDAAWIAVHPSDYSSAFVERAAVVVNEWPAKKAGLEAAAQAERDRRNRRLKVS